MLHNKQVKDLSKNATIMELCEFLTFIFNIELSRENWLQIWYSRFKIRRRIKQDEGTKLRLGGKPVGLVPKATAANRTGPLCVYMQARLCLFFLSHLWYLHNSVFSFPLHWDKSVFLPIRWDKFHSILTPTVKEAMVMIRAGFSPSPTPIATTHTLPHMAGKKEGMWLQL